MHEGYLLFLCLNQTFPCDKSDGSVTSAVRCIEVAVALERLTCEGEL